MKQEELLAKARGHLWAAWQLSSEEMGSQAAETLLGLGMLVPEGGAQELEQLRAENAELKAATYVAPSPSCTRCYGADAARFVAKGGATTPCRVCGPSQVEQLQARVAELEARLGEYGRPADEDPITYTLTAEASCGRALSTGEPCPDHPARTERSHWEAIAATLNATHAAGMPVGIDLDGTLTDRNAWSVVWDSGAERWTVAGYDDAEADGITRRIAPTQALREGQLAEQRHLLDPPVPPLACPEPGETPAALTVFRAQHDSIVMGLYTTRQAAYEHCEAYEMRDDSVSPMAWHVDEDGVAELVRFRIPRSPGSESATGYVVTPVEVASVYDEEADE